MTSYYTIEWQGICIRHGWSFYESPAEHWDELDKDEQEGLEEAERNDYLDFLERDWWSEYADLMY